MEYPGWGTPNPSTPFTPRGWGGDVDTPPKSPMLHYEEARLRDTGEREREREVGVTPDLLMSYGVAYLTPSVCLRW